jgi:dATP pyrophosphohydrolase
MGRAKFQVLIIPFRIPENGMPEFAVTKRFDMHVWQFLSGGGESDETPMQAAKREANEEGGIPYDLKIIRLDSTASIPAINFEDYEEWGNDVYVVPEYSFGVEMKGKDLTLSIEHTEIQWAHNKRSHLTDIPLVLQSSKWYRLFWQVVFPIWRATRFGSSMRFVRNPAPLGVKGIVGSESIHQPNHLLWG